MEVDTCNINSLWIKTITMIIQRWTSILARNENVFKAIESDLLFDLSVGSYLRVESTQRFV